MHIHGQCRMRRLVNVAKPNMVQSCLKSILCYWNEINHARMQPTCGGFRSKLLCAISFVGRVIKLFGIIEIAAFLQKTWWIIFKMFMNILKCYAEDCQFFFLLIQMDITLYMHLEHRPRLSWFSRSILCAGKLDELYEMNLNSKG